MNKSQEFDLAAYMSDGIREFMAAAYRNVLELGVRGALQSPLFRTLRDASILGWTHTGGCTLYEHRDEVETMMNRLKNS